MGCIRQSSHDPVTWTVEAGKGSEKMNSVAIKWRRGLRKAGCNAGSTDMVEESCPREEGHSSKVTRKSERKRKKRGEKRRTQVMMRRMEKDEDVGGGEKMEIGG